MELNIKKSPFKWYAVYSLLAACWSPSCTAQCESSPLYKGHIFLLLPCTDIPRPPSTILCLGFPLVLQFPDLLCQCRSFLVWARFTPPLLLSYFIVKGWHMCFISLKDDTCALYLCLNVWFPSLTSQHIPPDPLNMDGSLRLPRSRI